MDNKRATGARYEEMAIQYLKGIGYEILEKNFRCRLGEIDIIAKDQIYLVFIEVKFRATKKKGIPEEAITHRKQKIISKVADYYLMKTDKVMNIPIRFDVVTILGDKIKVYQNAFDYYN